MDVTGSALRAFAGHRACQQRPEVAAWQALKTRFSRSSLRDNEPIRF